MVPPVSASFGSFLGFDIERKYVMYEYTNIKVPCGVINLLAPATFKLKVISKTQWTDAEYPHEKWY